MLFITIVPYLCINLIKDYYHQFLLTFSICTFSSHWYNTRLASSSRIVSPFARKIYRKSNLQFQLGAQTLNGIDESTEFC